MPQKKVWIAVTLINILLTSIVVLEPSRTINPDGVLYLQTAEAYWKGGWAAAMNFYPWPFYSVLIAVVSHLIHCHLFQAAYLINILFQILICMGFIYLADEVGGFFSRKITDTQRLILYATLVILCYPTLNQQRDLIVRDFGYWAFSLWGWLYLVRLNHSGSFRDGLKFNFSMLLASLFRLEGMVMLLLAPFAVLANTQVGFTERAKRFIKTYSIFILGIVIGFIYFQIHIQTVNVLGRLIDLKTQVYSGISLIVQSITAAKMAIATQVLTPLSTDGALTLLLGGLVAIYAKTLLVTMTSVYSVLVITSFWKKSFLPALFARPVIGMAIGLNGLITLVFLGQNLFLDRRYIFELCCLLLLWIPFLLLWIRKQTEVKYPWVFPSMVGFLIGIGLLSLYNFGSSKYYLKEAGAWIHQQQIMSVKSFYTNSPQVSFYADSPRITWKSGVSPDNTKEVISYLGAMNYDYFVVQINVDNKKLKNQLMQYLNKPIKGFSNEKGDVVWVFNLKNKWDVKNDR